MKNALFSYMNETSSKVKEIRRLHTRGGIKYSAASHNNCLLLSRKVIKDKNHSLSQCTMKYVYTRVKL